MRRKHKILLSAVALSCLIAADVGAQGTFQNLDFENGSFVPIPGDPFGRVQFSAAMPGWTGYVGTNQISWIFTNSQFIDTAGISIYGPDNPSADYLHEHFFLILKSGFDPLDMTRMATPAITQTGMVPSTAQSIQLLNGNPFAIGTSVFFGGVPVPLYHLGGNSNGSQIWGGDVSSFQGQTGELRLFGSGLLDFIQFSNQPIPEPSVLGLFALGALLLGWRFVRGRR